MGCNACKRVESLDIPSEHSTRNIKISMNNQADSNSNECQYTQINISSIYLFGNKASNIKGKVKPEDREKIVNGIQSKMETERKTNRETIENGKNNSQSQIESNEKNLINKDKIQNPNHPKGESKSSHRDPGENKQNSDNNVSLLLSPSSFVIETKEKLTKKYEILGTIGRGAFGEVHKTRNKTNNEIYALKIIHKYLYPDIGSLIQEIEILKTLDHPNILRIYEFFQDKKSFYIISELNLLDIMQEENY